MLSRFKINQPSSEPKNHNCGRSTANNGAIRYAVVGRRNNLKFLARVLNQRMCY